MKPKIYEIKVESNADGKIQLTRTNNGFNGLELLGILEIAKNDVLEQLKGNELDKIEVIKKKLIEE